MGDDHRHEPSTEDDHAVLMRMLADSDRLCRTSDALLSGQAAQLRGRIRAMLEISGAEPEHMTESRQ